LEDRTALPSHGRDEEDALFHRRQTVAYFIRSA
jgi:hypothetical protein